MSDLNSPSQRFDPELMREIRRELRVRFGATLLLMGFFLLGRLAEAIRFPGLDWIYYFAWTQWVFALCFMDVWNCGVGFESREKFWCYAQEMLKARFPWHLQSWIFYTVAFFTHIPWTIVATYALCIASLLASATRISRNLSPED